MGTVPPNSSSNTSLGTSEKMQCDICECVHDLYNTSCTMVASSICLTMPFPQCPTVLSGMKSNIPNSITKAVKAIRERCPRLQVEPTNLCACLEYSDSEECQAAWTQECSMNSTLCVDKVKGLRGDAAAHHRYISYVAMVCDTEWRLVVWSRVMEGLAPESFNRQAQDRFRAWVADLVMTDVYSVTLLGYSVVSEQPGVRRGLNVSGWDSGNGCCTMALLAVHYGAFCSELLKAYLAMSSQELCQAMLVSAFVFVLVAREHVTAVRMGFPSPGIPFPIVVHAFQPFVSLDLSSLIPSGHAFTR